MAEIIEARPNLLFEMLRMATSFAVGQRLQTSTGGERLWPRRGICRQPDVRMAAVRGARKYGVPLSRADDVIA
jgi:hypothetical protein